jgi:D-alanyl-lipoteichoic acid acyltransferase DltB (MBOAT superfamily)
MIFNSFSFLIFVTLVFVIYWKINSKHILSKNLILLISSYIFYGLWDYTFLFLLIFSTLLDYFSGIKIFNSKKNKKKIWLITSISINLGLLFFFKYFNFFIQNFKTLFSKLGLELELSTLNILLPIGISFYTFHGLSYVIDIYRNKIDPEKNIINYSLFVSYFPLLVAGPIERATHLLPQLKNTRHFSYKIAANGMKQILWGLFIKIVIADNCANYVDNVFNFESARNGSSLFIASVLFAFQIYCDFSGYSNIASGVSRLFGIELIKNFNFPYFSRDISEFWRKWHISLSSWFRDYVYIPLGGSKRGKFRNVINIFIIFLISGFWHGSNWTFIFWGFLNALYFIPLLLTNKNRIHLDEIYLVDFKQKVVVLFQILFTFFLVVIGWIFFRSPNIDSAFRIISKIFSSEIFDNPTISPLLSTILLVVVMVLIEWFSRNDDFAIEKIDKLLSSKLRYIFYFLLIFSLFWFAGEEQQFIYFQF